MVSAQNVRDADRALSRLTPREQRILKMRHGIGVEDEMTLEQVGREFSLTRERIRQIEAQAKKKLRERPPCRASNRPLRARRESLGLPGGPHRPGSLTKS